MSGYQVWIVANRPYPYKAMGTDVSSAVPNCGAQQPSLFFLSQEDAQAYRDQLAWQLRDSFQIYSAIMEMEK